MRITKNTLLVFPIFNRQGKVEIKNQRIVRDWLKANKHKFYDDFGIGFSPMIIGTGISNIDKSENKSTEFLKLTPKAEVIKHAFASMFKEDRQGNKIVKYDYAICIDGDGDINFDYIFNVLECLLQGNKVVYACRKGKYGLQPEIRNYIEYFENGILEIIFKKRIPDGQCGCYGFSYDVVRELSLTASNFEIELDILINILQNGKWELAYFPIEIEQEPNQSNFDSKHSIEKLNFINKKLGLNQSFLNKYYEFFKRKYKMEELPKEYVNNFKDIMSLSTLEIPQIIHKEQPICIEQRGKRCMDCDLENIDSSEI